MKTIVRVVALLLLAQCFAAGSQILAQQKTNVLVGNFCEPPKLASVLSEAKVDEDKVEPKGIADLGSAIQTVEQALKCYQVLSGEKDPLHPKGLPKLNSVVLDFKTTTAKTVGFSISVFVFKVGASREKDVTDDLTFTYSVPKKLQQVHGVVKPSPAPMYEELVKEVQMAANAAQTQSKLLGIPLSKVGVSVSYGIKFDGNLAISVPIQLVTIGGNGDYNKNNTQSITLSFEEPTP